jgi:hypothetical protein
MKSSRPTARSRPSLPSLAIVLRKSLELCTQKSASLPIGAFVNVQSPAIEASMDTAVSSAADSLKGESRLGPQSEDVEVACSLLWKRSSGGSAPTVGNGVAAGASPALGSGEIALEHLLSTSQGGDITVACSELAGGPSLGQLG